MVNRRRFVSTAAAAVVAATLPGFLAPAAAAKRPKSKKNLTAKWWRKRLNRRAVLQGNQWHSVEIVAVDEHDASPELEQFTISFRCSPGDEVSEGIYKVKVKGGRVKLYLQPAGGDELGNYCVAAVSRLV